MSTETVPAPTKENDTPVNSTENGSEEPAVGEKRKADDHVADATQDKKAKPDDTPASTDKGKGKSSVTEEEKEADKEEVDPEDDDDDPSKLIITGSRRRTNVVNYADPDVYKKAGIDPDAEDEDDDDAEANPESPAEDEDEDEDAPEAADEDDAADDDDDDEEK